MRFHFPVLFTNDLIQELIALGSYESYSNGEILTIDNSNQHLNYFMINGLAKVYLEKKNQKLFLSYQNGNDFNLLNLVSCTTNQTESFSFIFIKHSQVFTLSNKHLFDMFLSYPIFKKHIYDCYQKKNHLIINTLKNSLKISLLDRLYHYLKIKSYYLNTPKIPYSIHEIAEDLQFSRQSISKNLRILQSQQKIIRTIDILIIS